MKKNRGSAMVVALALIAVGTIVSFGFFVKSDSKLRTASFAIHSAERHNNSDTGLAYAQKTLRDYLTDGMQRMFDTVDNVTGQPYDNDEDLTLLRSLFEGDESNPHGLIAGNTLGAITIGNSLATYDPFTGRPGALEWVQNRDEGSSPNDPSRFISFQFQTQGYFSTEQKKNRSIPNFALTAAIAQGNARIEQDHDGIIRMNYRFGAAVRGAGSSHVSAITPSPDKVLSYMDPAHDSEVSTLDLSRYQSSLYDDTLRCLDSSSLRILSSDEGEDQVIRGEFTVVLFPGDTVPAAFHQQYPPPASLYSYGSMARGAVFDGENILMTSYEGIEVINPETGANHRIPIPGSGWFTSGIVGGASHDGYAVISQSYSGAGNCSTCASNPALQGKLVHFSTDPSAVPGYEVIDKPHGGFHGEGPVAFNGKWVAMSTPIGLALYNSERPADPMVGVSLGTDCHRSALGSRAGDPVFHVACGREVFAVNAVTGTQKLIHRMPNDVSSMIQDGNGRLYVTHAEVTATSGSPANQLSVLDISSQRILSTANLPGFSSTLQNTLWVDPESGKKFLRFLVAGAPVDWSDPGIPPFTATLVTYDVTATPNRIHQVELPLAVAIGAGFVASDFSYMSVRWSPNSRIDRYAAPPNQVNGVCSLALEEHEHS